jgi:hypothetical protein
MLELCYPCCTQKLVTIFVKQQEIVVTVFAPDRQVQNQMLSTSAKPQIRSISWTLITALDRITPQIKYRCLTWGKRKVGWQFKPQSEDRSQDSYCASHSNLMTSVQSSPNGCEFLEARTACSKVV